MRQQQGQLQAMWWGTALLLLLRLLQHLLGWGTGLKSPQLLLAPKGSTEEAARASCWSFDKNLALCSVRGFPSCVSQAYRRQITTECIVLCLANSNFCMMQCRVQALTQLPYSLLLDAPSAAK
jgi:hypothetical protein